MDIFSWLETSMIGVMVRQSSWGYPIVLASHAIGMGIVVGAALMFNLRVLGYARRMSIEWFDQIYTLAWLGFLVNLISGAMLFTGDPEKFTYSTAFQLKIALIIAGGLSLRHLGRLVNDPQQMSAHGAASGRIRLTAALSMTFWLGAIVAGRLIAYTT